MIFNGITRAKDLYYKNASSGLKAGDVQEAIDETKGLVDQIANKQIPQQYLEATVERYVAENHSGLATKEDLEETAADLKSDLSKMDESLDYRTLNIYNPKEYTPINGTVNYSADNGEYIATSSRGHTIFVPVTEGKKYVLCRNITDAFISIVGFAEKTEFYAKVSGRHVFCANGEVKDTTNPYVMTAPTGYPYLAISLFDTGYETKYTEEQLMESYQIYEYESVVNVSLCIEEYEKSKEVPVVDVFEDEVKDTIFQIQARSTSKALLFALLTDSHVTDDSRENWFKQTVSNLKKVNSAVSFDGVIHLGDLIDGYLDKDTILDYTSNSIEQLLNVGAKQTFFVEGNHDGFYTGSDGYHARFTDAEMYGFFHRYNEVEVVRDSNPSNYYVDYKNHKLRMIILDSCYDGSGFSTATVTWLTNVLSGAESDYKFVIFSHVPTRPELNYNASIPIENHAEVENLLKSYGTRVLGYFHGHTHMDNVSYVNGFPEIAIACNQCLKDSFNITGATSPNRAEGTVTQDLWDAVLILPYEQKFELVRFGAGENRTVPFRQ